MSAGTPPVVSPNPFVDRTSIHYSIGTGASLSGRVPVEITIHDLQGRIVRVLERAAHAPGAHAAEWDGRNSSGGRVVPGIYYARVRLGGTTWRGRVVVLH